MNITLLCLYVVFGNSATRRKEKKRKEYNLKSKRKLKFDVWDFIINENGRHYDLFLFLACACVITEQKHEYYIK